MKRTRLSLSIGQLATCLSTIAMTTQPNVIADLSIEKWGIFAEQLRMLRVAVAREPLTSWPWEAFGPQDVDEGRPHPHNIGLAFAHWAPLPTYAKAALIHVAPMVEHTESLVAAIEAVPGWKRCIAYTNRSATTPGNAASGLDESPAEVDTEQTEFTVAINAATAWSTLCLQLAQTMKTVDEKRLDPIGKPGSGSNRVPILNMSSWNFWFDHDLPVSPSADCNSHITYY